MSWLAHPVAVGARNALRRVPLVMALYRRWMATRSYEDRFGERLLEQVTASSVVWDIGANTGLYVRQFLEKGARQVVAVEPAPDAVRALQSAFDGIRAVRIVQIALSNAAGTSRFLADGASVTNRLVGEPGAAPEGSVEVLVRRADELVSGAEALPMPTVIKIDVEGYELEVLEGFGDLLSRPGLRAVFVEVHFGNLHRRGMDHAPTRIDAILRSAGFEVDWLDLSHVSGLRH